MLFVCGIASDPDTIIRNQESVFDGDWGLAPFKIEDVVGDVGPVLSHIFSVVQLLVNAAGLVLELSTGGP